MPNLRSALDARTPLGLRIGAHSAGASESERSAALRLHIDTAPLGV